MLKIEKIPALGTLWWFELFDAEETERTTLTEAIINRMKQFEERYSRFLPSSQVCQLNTTGMFKYPSDEFLSLLAHGQRLYADTDGVFNFLSAHTQVAQGYGSADSVRPATDAAPANPAEDLVIAKDKVILRKGAVDLGGFGKGWLIDDIARLLQTSLRIGHFLINGGGDIYATTAPDGSPVEITVEHPTRQGYGIATYPLANQGFAASSTHKRKWKHNGKQRNHLLTQHGNDMAVHIVADTALSADTLATVACASDPQKLQNLLDGSKAEYLVVSEGKLTHSEKFTLLAA